MRPRPHGFAQRHTAGDAGSADIPVQRVANRWGYVRTKTPEQTLTALEASLPMPYRPSINRLVLPFGKYICTSPAPKCASCSLADICPKIGLTTVSRPSLPVTPTIARG